MTDGVPAHVAGLRALVGGASRGIGRAIAEQLAHGGARVAAVAREEGPLCELTDTIGGVPIAADLSTAAGVRQALDRTVGELGGLDLLVINSGGPAPGTLLDVDDAGWEDAIAGTLMPAVRLLRDAVPHLRAGRTPSVLLVLSSSVHTPIPGLLTSNVLRPGLAGLVRAAAVELAPEIRVNGVAPGRIDTDRVRTMDERRAGQAGIAVAEQQRETAARIPLGRYGEPAELARAATFLLSPAASYLTGQVVFVDGGMTSAPA